jgi:hypothetical protein
VPIYNSVDFFYLSSPAYRLNAEIQEISKAFDYSVEFKEVEFKEKEDKRNKPTDLPYIKEFDLLYIIN